MTVIEHEPGAIRASAEDCENASLPAAAQTLRDLAGEVEASRPQLRGGVSRDTLESDRFLDRVLDKLEECNGQPLNLARWDLKAAIRAALVPEAEVT